MTDVLLQHVFGCPTQANVYNLVADGYTANSLLLPKIKQIRLVSSVDCWVILSDAATEPTVTATTGMLLVAGTPEVFTTATQHRTISVLTVDVDDSGGFLNITVL